LADSMNPRERSKWEHWSRASQEGEFQFHVTNQWRRTERFVADTARLFRFFRFGPDDFEGCVVLDLGSGPRLRSKFFKNAKIVAVEPLAERFLAEIGWCDLQDAWRVHPEPAEKMIPELEGQADFIMCINVLDHTYDPLHILLNARLYLKASGQMLLSVDLHDKADEMHPVHFDRPTLEAIVKKAGFSIQWSHLGLPNSDAYGQGRACTLMLTPANTIHKHCCNAFLFVCSNGNHVKTLAPVADRLRGERHSVRFFSLDAYYGQGANEVLSSLDFIWAEVPRLVGRGDWFERSAQARHPLTIEALQAIKAIFAAGTPDCVVVANDTGTLEQFFLRTAECYGTRTVLVQDGICRAKPIGHGQSCEKIMGGDGSCELLCVWGEGVAGRLANRGVSGRIAVTGNPRYDTLAGCQSRPSPNQPPTVVLAGQCYAKYGSLSADKEYTIYERILRLLAHRDDIHTIFKLHPQQDPTRYLALRELLDDRVEVLQDVDSIALLKRADALLSIRSTISLEAILMDVPMVMLHLLGGEIHPDFEGVPFIVESEGAFLHLLSAPDFPNNLRLEPKIREAFIRKTVYALDGKASARVAEAIMGLMKRPDITQQVPQISVLMVLRTSKVNPTASVRSVLRSSTIPLEVVVVDQTPDGAIGRGLKNIVRDERLSILHEPQSTLGAALNKGLSACRGEIVARLEPGCIALPRWAERLNAASVVNPHPAFVVSWHILCDDFGNFRSISTLPSDARLLWEIQNPLPAPVYAYHRGHALAKGGYVETPELDSDYALMLALLDSGNVAVVPAMLYAVMKSETFSTRPALAPSSLSLKQQYPTNELDISVLLCSYNRADTLKRCLEALEKQTLHKDRFEVICVNDGSTDNTCEVMQEALKQLPGSYHEHPENRGLAAARNTALRAARGQLVLFINDDTHPEPDLLEQHLQMHQMHDNERIAVLGHIRFSPEHSERILSQVLHQHNLLFPLVGTREQVPYDFNYFVTANLSVARQAFISENVWFDETFRRYGCEDIEVGYRLWKRGYRVYYCPRAKVIHDHRLTVRDYQQREAANSSNLVQFIDKHPELVPRYLGVPRLTETVFDQWRQVIKQEAPVIKKMVDRITAVEDVTPAALAGSTVTPSDAAELIRKIAVLLKHISEHIKRQTILQILDDSPDVRHRLVNSTGSQPQSKTVIERKPLVSVIIPCYKYGCYLPEAVSSVLNQTCRDFEIIIVNDGSPDDTKEVAKKLIAENPQHQIRLINQANSGQPAIARNRGIAEAKAEYILPLDADDKLAPQAIESYLRAVEDYPNQPIVVFGWLQRFGVEKNLWKTQSFSPNQLLHRTLLPYCSMYHRSVWESQGGYATNVPGYEDWDFWIGAAERGAKFVNVPFATTFYRRTAESSLVDSSRQKHEWLVAGIISNHPDIYEDYEVAWAGDYLKRFPQPPEEREVHGQQSRYPKAVAALIISYPDLYTSEEVDWAKQFLRKNPFKILKGIKPGQVKVDTSCKPKGTTDLDYFVKAGREFTKGNFETAVEYMQKYRLMTDYSKLPRILSTSKENDEVAISVIVVTYNKAGDLKKCLESLSKQDSRGYEVIVVDNGQSDVEVFKQYIDQYIKCPINFNLSEGRNIGVHFARGRIIVFLDDDALVGSNYISSIKSAFENFDIFGLRGRAYPKTSPDANNHINVYDLGDKPFPSYCNQEGNSAFLLEVYKKMQGMDPLLFGHEGSDLTYRIIKEYKLLNKIIYWPWAVIYHDYGIGDKFNQKKKRYLQNAIYLKYKHNTDIFINRRSIEKYPIDLKQKKNWSNELHLDRAAPLFQGKPAARVPTAAASHPQPKVSIIIPCYNSERFLPECLDNIRNQTMRQWELFLLDDASTDGTKSVIERYCRMDERIKPYYFQDNKGPYVRRNFAIEQANSDFIVIQDTDDIACPAKLEILYNEITKDARLGIVGSFYWMFLIEFKGLKYTDKIGFPLTHDAIIEQYRSRRDFCWHGSAIIRKELFEAIGLYDENPFSSDSFWLAKTAVYATHSGNIKLKNIPEFLTLKRAHPISQTGVLPTFDQRSKRAKFHIYWRYKLSKIIEKLHNNPNVDIKAELGNCKCNDYIERYGHLFEQWESEPLNDEMLNMLISIVVGLFNNRRYVSCIVRLEGMETIAHNIAKRFKNYDLLRAIAYFAIDMKHQSLKYLNKEIQNHKNPAARQFISDYFENPSETDVYSWCLENGKFYDLQIIDLEDESGTEQRSCVVSDRHSPARQGKQVKADRNLSCGQKEPLVTVIMPVYNGANYIGEAIDSVLSQSYRKFELVIVDDGSTDNTKEVISRYKDERINYIYKENGGPSSARNCAIRKTKGQYIMPLDSDDMMAPNFITLHLQEFEKYPETDLVYCDVLLIDGDGKPIKVMNKPEYQDRRHLIKDLFRQGHPVIPFRLGIRKRVFDKIGLYDETLMIGEDYDMMRRFVKAGLKAHHLSEALHLRRVQSNSLSRNFTAENAKLHFEVVKRFTDTFTYDELFPDVDWNKIAPEMRQMHAKCLAAVTYLAIGGAYVKSSSSAIYAKIAFEQACSELRSSLKMDPENERIRQLLQKCELGKQKYTEQIQQAVC